MYETGDLILVGLGAAVLGFAAAVVITLPALKKAAKETEKADAEVMILKRMQAGVDFRQKPQAAEESMQQKSLTEAPLHEGV